MKSYRIRIGMSLGLAAMGVLLAGCSWQHETMLYVRDEVCRPGDSVNLTAKLEENNWRWKDVHGKCVSFACVDSDGKPGVFASDVTDSDGYATASFAPPAEGEYPIDCRFWGAPRFGASSFRSFVFCRTPTRYGVILDIDRTLAATTARDILAGRFRLALPLDRDTVRVVNALAKEYDVFIVTSRPRTQASTVLEWLARNGFPRVPTYFYDPRRDAVRPAMAKRKIIQELKRAYPRIAIGIGDRESDLEGYMRDGLLAMGIRKKEEGAFSAYSWSDVEALLLTTRGARRIPSELTVYRGEAPLRFRLSKGDGGYLLECSLPDGERYTCPPAPWPEQFKNILQAVTSPESAASK